MLLRTMKRHYSFFAGLLLLAQLISCRSLPDTPLHSLDLSISMPGSTRVSGQTDDNERRVSGIQVFVFDETGGLETYGSAAVSSLSLRCRSGSKQVWALANAPDLSGITREAELASSVSLLTDNTPSRLVMVGHRQIEVQADLSGTIEVGRVCAKLVVGTISRSFSSPVLQEKPFRIEKIYVTNVAGDQTYDLSADPTVWYNRMGDRGECTDLLCDVVRQEVDATLTGRHSFYVYPNASLSTVRGGTWSPRPTRIVIAATLDGSACYYVIDVPGIEPNHAYELSDILLTRPGSGNEEEVTSESAVRFQFSVREWEETEPYTENL